MTTTKYKENLSEYSPSINIERDFARKLNYIPTKNAIGVLNTIANDYKIGIRSFSLVGAYGTGKSAFLLGLQKSLTGKNKYFSLGKNQFDGVKNYEFLNLTGQYESLIQNFAILFNIGKKRDYSAIEVLAAIDVYSKKLTKAGKILVIVIDEFGKYLEYAAKYNPEKELYFIQLLAELTNNDVNTLEKQGVISPEVILAKKLKVKYAALSRSKSPKERICSFRDYFRSNDSLQKLITTLEQDDSDLNDF